MAKRHDHFNHSFITHGAQHKSGTSLGLYEMLGRFVRLSALSPSLSAQEDAAAIRSARHDQRSSVAIGQPFSSDGSVAGFGISDGKSQNAATECLCPRSQRHPFSFRKDEKDTVESWIWRPNYSILIHYLSNVILTRRPRALSKHRHSIKRLKGCLTLRQAQADNLPAVALVILLMLGLSNLGTAQISPGPLSNAHAEYEGITNCTLCHDLGKQVSSAKCLDCHEDIQLLIDQERGYHASQEVLSKECFECHGEHHGENFDSRRFDEDSFDHDLTTYTLEGQHDVIDCRECHNPEYIEDAEIAKRDDTFLGLSHDCIACHDDYHQGTLTNNEDCASCHDIEAFRPAPYFDHDDTNYPLEGKHIEVDCKECHAITTRNGIEFQEFTGMPFNDCVACHEDPHESQLPGDCAQCHSVDGFEVFLGQLGFDHNQTQFELRGSHVDVACFECHTPELDAQIILQDQNGIGQNECIACHEDVHEGKFGNSCVDCHNEDSWLIGGDLENFDHDLTDYPLIGMHVEVDCKECHVGSYTEPLAHERCMDCHDDFHEGVFVADNATSDCMDCHAVTVGFEETTFTIERHQEASFALEGGHLATPCFACHLDEAEEWLFRDLRADCVDCHEDIHRGQFAENEFTDCTQCHDSETWFPTFFDHDNTEFVLEGQHAEVSCAACHLPESEEDSFVNYQIKSFECVDCHPL